MLIAGALVSALAGGVAWLLWDAHSRGVVKEMFLFLCGLAVAIVALTSLATGSHARNASRRWGRRDTWS